MNVLDTFSKFLNELNLFLIPLFSIKNNVCSCNKGSFCKSPGKHPKSLSWKSQSHEKYQREIKYGITNNKENQKNILKYFSDSLTGNCNLAITTGKYSKDLKKHLIVVDVDLGKAKDETVKKNLEIFCEELGRKTFYYKTGSGGYHFWVWSEKLLKNSAGKFYENIDIRGEGGYVVIPPSNHISGGDYEVVSEEAFKNGIKDINVFYEALEKIKKIEDSEDNILLKPKLKRAAKSLEEVQTKDNSDAFRVAGEIKAALMNKGASWDEIKYWSSRDLKRIKDDLRCGRKQIPVGIRNVTIYRLLSSDHHLGATKADLIQNTSVYHGFCEDMYTVTRDELLEMIERISKYETFKNDRDVNYSFYLMAQKNSVFPFTEKDYKLLVELDNHFFDALEPSDEPTKIINLIECRKRNIRFFTKRFPDYNQACFAHQLKKRGFVKTRKGGYCFWNVKFNHNKFIKGNPWLRELLAKAERKNTPVSPMVFEKAVWKREEIKKFNNVSSSATVNPGNPIKELIETQENRVFNMTIQVKEVSLKIKNKKHPSAIRYPGKANYELNKTYIPFLTNLSPEDVEKMDNFELFLDEHDSREEFATVLPGDKVGFMAKYDNGVVSSVGEVLEIKENSFILKDIYNKEELELGFAEASVGRHIGYFEILYRNDKPYGIPEEEEVTVNVEWEDGEPAQPPQAQVSSDDVPDTPKDTLEKLADKAGGLEDGILAASTEHIKEKKKTKKKKT